MTEDTSPESSTDQQTTTSGAPGAPGAPRWVKLSGLAIVVVAIVVIVVTLLGGNHGPGRHQMEGTGSEGLPTASQSIDSSRESFLR